MFSVVATGSICNSRLCLVWWLLLVFVTVDYVIVVATGSICKSRLCLMWWLLVVFVTVDCVQFGGYW
jgi:hypothetical protein